MHAGYGPEGQMWIIRKHDNSMRYRPDNIQQKDSPPEKNRPRVHCWTAFGHNFKSRLIFYKVPGNTNGKLTHKAYIEQILEIEVKRWIEKGHDFVLEKDDDSVGIRSNLNNPAAQ